MRDDCRVLIAACPRNQNNIKGLALTR